MKTLQDFLKLLDQLRLLYLELAEANGQDGDNEMATSLLDDADKLEKIVDELRANYNTQNQMSLMQLKNIINSLDKEQEKVIEEAILCFSERIIASIKFQQEELVNLENIIALLKTE